MDDSQKRKSRLEIGHVLFIDIAGYSKLTTEDWVRLGSNPFGTTSAQGLLRESKTSDVFA